MSANKDSNPKGLKFIKAFVIGFGAVLAESWRKSFKKTKPANQHEYDIETKKSGCRKPKVYKLRGYTTTSRVDKKVRGEQNQRMLRNFLVAAIFVLLIAILLIIFNPLKDLRELFRLIGV